MTITIDPFWFLTGLCVAWAAIGLALQRHFFTGKWEPEDGPYFFCGILWPLHLLCIAVVGIVKEFVRRYKDIHPSDRKKLKKRNSI